MQGSAVVLLEVVSSPGTCAASVTSPTPSLGPATLRLLTWSASISPLTKCRLLLAPCLQRARGVGHSSCSGAAGEQEEVVEALAETC